MASVIPKAAGKLANPEGMKQYESRILTPPATMVMSLSPVEMISGLRAECL